MILIIYILHNQYLEKLRTIFKKSLIKDIQKPTLNNIPHILIGVNEMQIHPDQIKTPPRLAKIFPKLRFFKIRLTGKIPYSGSLGGHNIQIRGLVKSLSLY